MGLIKLVEGDCEFLTEKIGIKGEEGADKFSEDLTNKMNDLANGVANGKFKNTSDLLEAVNETLTVEELLMVVSMNIVDKVSSNPLAALAALFSGDE